jgi:hypothetical protein
VGAPGWRTSTAPQEDDTGKDGIVGQIHGLDVKFLPGPFPERRDRGLPFRKKRGGTKEKILARAGRETPQFRQ